MTALEPVTLSHACASPSTKAGTHPLVVRVRRGFLPSGPTCGPYCVRSTTARSGKQKPLEQTPVEPDPVFGRVAPHTGSESDLAALSALGSTP